ncbi:MAG: hypothetical protein Q7Q71_07675 [Verrucomicrobiota bacterium JB023]|nr:hypothetical protein [Verrucomicrobiota bacterium JB023]
MKICPPIPRVIARGFTLMELSVTIMFGLIVASVGLTLINQQARLMSILNEQNFILHEAPMINRTLTSILSKADAIRIHKNFNSARNGNNYVNTNGRTIIVAYRNPDDTTTYGIIDYKANEDILNYYYYDPDDGGIPNKNSYDWTIGKDLTNVRFSLVDGLFQAMLQGPNGETITYTISPDQ